MNHRTTHMKQWTTTTLGLPTYNFQNFMFLAKHSVQCSCLELALLMAVENAGILLNGLLDVRPRSQLAERETKESHRNVCCLSPKPASGCWRGAERRCRSRSTSWRRCGHQRWHDAPSLLELIREAECFLPVSWTAAQLLWRFLWTSVQAHSSILRRSWSPHPEAALMLKTY